METQLATSLDLAFDRLADFLSVQRPLSTDDLEPIFCLQAAVGVGEAERERLHERLGEFAGEGHRGAVALGVLIGLFAAQFAQPSAESTMAGGPAPAGEARRVAYMRRRPAGFWIAAAFAVALVAFVVDQSTGDETGPPYDDPLINKIAFGVFMGAMLLFVVLCAIALVRRIAARGASDSSASG